MNEERDRESLSSGGMMGGQQQPGQLNSCKVKMWRYIFML